MLIRVTMDYVKSKISQYPVYVFSKTHCPYCDKAKQALDSLGAKYEVEEIENRPDVDDIQNALAQLTGARTASFYIWKILLIHINLKFVTFYEILMASSNFFLIS